jgi:hypothetical protein
MRSRLVWVILGVPAVVCAGCGGAAQTVTVTSTASAVSGDVDGVVDDSHSGRTQAGRCSEAVEAVAMSTGRIRALRPAGRLHHDGSSEPHDQPCLVSSRERTE